MSEMSTLFDTGVKQFTTKFNGLMSDISVKSIETIAKSRGYSMEALKRGLESNSEEFRMFCVNYASTLIPGRVGGCTYAAVVASIAQKVGLPYKAYAGFCLQKNSPRYARDKAEWEAKKASGAEHPFFATSVYVEVNGIEYECWNNETTGFEHLDMVQIAEG